MFRNKETFERVCGGGKMNEDWGKAIAQLCAMIQNDTDLKEPVLQYVEFMKMLYGIDSGEFSDIYKEWERSGEIVDKREKEDCVRLENVDKNLYPESMDGLCRLYDEGMLEEDAFCEILSEEDYEIKNGTDGKIIGFYPQYPGCIGFAGNREMLDAEMQKSLKNWIHTAYIIWKENKILVK